MVTTAASEGSPLPHPLPSKRARIIYGLLDLLSAAAVAGLASVLWTGNQVWIAALWLWTLLLVCSAIGLFSGSRIGRLAARAASAFQLGLLGLLVVVILSSVAFLWGVYGQIGLGIAVALLLVLALLVEVMGLLPVFKLRALGMFERRPPSALHKAMPVAAVLLAVGVVVYCGTVYARVSFESWEPTPTGSRDTMAQYLMAVVQDQDLPALPEDSGGANDRWIVRVYRSGALESRMEVEGTMREATLDAAAAIDTGASTGRGRRSIAIDRVAAEARIEPRVQALSALSIVPGLDGISGEIDGKRYTLTPHELVLKRMLSEHTPIPFIPEFEIGIDVTATRPILCANAGYAPDCNVVDLRRVRTESWARHRGKTFDLYRGRPTREESFSAADAKAGAIAAGYYVARSLKRDGRFQYQLAPDTGKSTMEPYNIPRHAGTAWFLLELYESTERAIFLRSAERALDWLQAKLADCGDGRRCIVDWGHARLGSTALPLIAFATHARATGSDRYADTIDQLAEIVELLQREDGDFDFVLDLKTGRPVPGDRRLYEAGQGALALALVGQVTGDKNQLDGARRALDFIAGPYWDFPLSDFFFIEEHWACLAANEFHRLHAVPEHARFCRNAASFDRKLQHAKGQTVFPDYVGGIGFSPFFPPYTTTAAGRTEGMIAAYRISEREKDPDPELRKGIIEAVEFLLHNQYSELDSYAFRSSWGAIGGVPWNYYDPTIRIDTVQHAGSVMLHGADLLPEVDPN